MGLSEVAETARATPPKREQAQKAKTSGQTRTPRIEGLQEFLDYKAAHYQSAKFIASDPIQIPHRFSEKQDIEITALLSATLAWGNRKAIVKSGLRMLELLDHAPYDFVKNHKTKDLKKLTPFAHRTFDAGDFQFFVRQLQRLYEASDTLELYFRAQAGERNLKQAASRFRSRFLGLQVGHHAAKHVSNPLGNSACKRLNLFLRWMVRSAASGVDFGLWKQIDSGMLSIPLDVHSGRVARELGLLTRRQNDGKAVEELDQNLRKLDASDPVKYDFALFGLGAFEGF